MKPKPKPRFRRHLETDTTKINILLSIVICLLSIGGSCIGIIITSDYASKAYTHQQTFEWESRILDKRFETIDKLARLIAQQPGIQDEWQRYLNSGIATPPRESSEKLAAYNSEYQSTLMLAELYFGKKTSEAIKSLIPDNSPWWMKTRDSQFAVLSAMTEELTLAIPTLMSTVRKPTLKE